MKIKIMILKNDIEIKSFISNETDFQKDFNTAVDIAGGMYNGKDEFVVTSKKIKNNHGK